MLTVKGRGLSERCFAEAMARSLMLFGKFWFIMKLWQDKLAYGGLPQSPGSYASQMQSHQTVKFTVALLSSSPGVSVSVF